MEGRGATQAVGLDMTTGERTPAYARLTLAAIAASPFQYALTLRIGFPLKISELLIIVAAMTFLATPRRRPEPRDAGNVIVGILLLAVAISGLINLTIPSSLSNPPGFDRPVTVDLLLYVGYAALVGLAWAMMRTLAPDEFGRALVVAVWLCGAATMFQSLMMTVGHPEVLEALGFTSSLSGRTLGEDTLRSGPFLEGQHLGFFAGAGMIVCLHHRAWFGVAIALGTALYSESTTTIVGIVVGAVLAILARPNAKVITSVGAVAVGVGVTVAAYQPLREWVLFQAAKLGIVVGDQYSRYITLSLDIRTAKTEIGWRILAEHPLVGVGSGRYGIAFHDFSDQYQLPRYYYDGSVRAIAENAYAQMAAEHGLLGLGALVALVGLLVLRTVRRRPYRPALVALAGYVTVAISTQSSWTFIPIWVMFAYLAIDHSESPVRRATRGRTDEAARVN